MRHWLAFLLALLLFAPASLQAETGTFLHVSDIHFDPFDPPELPRALSTADASEWPALFAALPDQRLSRYGGDTNHALLTSAMTAIRQSSAEADFALLSGDLLAHRFEEQSGQLLGVPQRSETVEAFAVRTTLFVAKALAAALPGKPVFVSLGNNDSACGDYRIEPGGDYLAATRETVRRLAGASRVEPDFDETYAAGGYYAARHPTVPGAAILVLNDVLWSTEYLDACGNSGVVAGDAMLAWLKERLKRQRQAGGKIWLVRHIPLGVDAYATATASAASCPAQVKPFLKEPYAAALLDLLTEYAGVIQASFSGHSHFDDYRLILDAQGEALGVEKIAPAISPIFGQNPGFHLFSYDRATGDLRDFSTTWLTNLATASGPPDADWRLEYTFAQAYGAPGYSPASVRSVLASIEAAGPARAIYENLYDVSRGDFDPVSFPAHACALGQADVEAFTACFCGQ